LACGINGQILSRLALAGDVFFHHLLTGRHRPFLASYKLTYRCNLRCRQCPFPEYSGKDPTYAEVCRVLDTLQLRGDRVVIFEGGEPLLWRDGDHKFNDLARYARRRFACVGVTTNGTLPLDVETDVLWVSVDGFAETHNRLRNADIFEHVIANARHSTHPRLYAHITANAENRSEIPDLVRFLSEIFKGITVQFYYPYGTDDRLLLEGEQRRSLIEELIQLKREGYPLLNSTASLQALQTRLWKCQSWRIDCANPDGSFWQGCYLRSRAEIDCAKCGFSPYTELSLAFQGNPQAIWAGMKIFM
jgi:Fe-coproporphyrin III synthase